MSSSAAARCPGAKLGNIPSPTIKIISRRHCEQGSVLRFALNQHDATFPLTQSCDVLHEIFEGRGRIVKVEEVLDPGVQVSTSLWFT